MKLFIPAVLIVLAAGFVIFQSQSKQQPVQPSQRTTTNVSHTQSQGKTIDGYQGSLLAGNTSPLLDFKKQDYDKALAANKIILLYFYANWCPVCRVEVPQALYPAFNELTESNIIGFRVNYNDDQTDADEKALAEQFDITYQHSKVILKNGKEVLKSLETWEKERYLEETNKVL